MTAVVKERGILFAGDMVRALRDGRKTQTRRAVKPQSDWITSWAFNDCMDFWEAWGDPDERGGCHTADVPCPYGLVGDRLWVRETWCEYGKGNIIYRADYSDGMGPIGDGIGGPWKPSIHMPRRFSRFTLTLTDIRVERIRDISSADCVAEGLLPTMRNEPPVKERFQKLIESHGRKGIWDANDWVWALTFTVEKSQ